MAERTLPGLGLTGYWDLGYTGWKTGMDTNLRLLSAVTQLSVLSVVTSMPGSPTDGDIHLVSGGANDNKVAIRDNGAWVYLTPTEGWVLWNRDTDTIHVFDGTIWTDLVEPFELPDMTGKAGYALTVNDTEDGIEWTLISDGGGGGITDAPSDGLPYVRKDAAWVNIGPVDLNTQTASYILVIGDAQKMILMNIASANTVTVPPDADVSFPIGTSIAISQIGVGQTSLVAGSGVTIRTPETMNLRVRYSQAYLLKIATNEWMLTGDLEVI